MSASSPSSSFDPSWYPLWCRAWLHARRHLVRLGDLVQNQPSRTLETKHASVRTRLDSVLRASLTKLDSGQADDALLLRTHACLHTLEAAHGAEVKRKWQRPPIVETGLDRRLLVPPPRHSARPDDPDLGFPLGDELGVAVVLGLNYRWLPIQAEDELDWSSFSDLDSLRHQGAVHLGLAPLASMADMGWEIRATEPLGHDHRVPLRCTGARDASVLWDRIEAILGAAYTAGVQILLMPELVIDEGALARCQAWLQANNFREPRLLLVVAGSRHCDCGNGFANRCTVLSHAGDVLWEQDKRSPFVIEDRATLDCLSPDHRVERAFEPTALGRRLVIAETLLGRILTPICLDFIEGEFWGDLGADLYLVPAMTGALSRFQRKAEDLGGRHGAATLVCNARTDKERYYPYRPARSQVAPIRQAGVELFTVVIELAV